MTQPLVCSFESRRATEMKALIERHGGHALSAPSMQEIAIDENPEAIEFIRRAIADEFPVVILMTGVGTDALFDVARSQNQYEELLQAFHRAHLVVRGPKPASALAKAGLKYAIKAPEPNTWRELLQSLDLADKSADSGIKLQGCQIAVQEYGLPNQQFYEALNQRGAVITRVPVYRWALPDDLEPLQNCIHQIVRGEADLLMFTSANQVSNVLLVAEQLGLDVKFRDACSDVMLASIGPTCSEALKEQGFRVDYEASPPKMGPMVRGALQAWTIRNVNPGD